MNEKDLSSKKISEGSWKCCSTMRENDIPTLFSRKVTRQVKRISYARAYMDSFMKESHPACKTPELTANQFNLYGKSPLMVYFFLNYSPIQLPGRDLLVSRREKTEIIPDNTLTYADIIQLVTKNMAIRRKKLRQLDRMYENEWNCFNNYLMELQENYERELVIIDKKEKEKKKAKHMVVSSSTLFDYLFNGKAKGNPHKEIAFLSRKEKREVEGKQKGFQSPFSLENSVDNYSLGLKSPYIMKSASSKPSSSKSKGKQDMLFRLSPSSIE